MGENGASGNSEDSLIIEECSGLNIQELCNGTIASPCNCQASQQCQVCSIIMCALIFKFNGNGFNIFVSIAQWNIIIICTIYNLA